MRYSIRWLSEAERDATELLLFVKGQFGIRVGKKVLKDIDDTIQLLSFTPFIGHKYENNPAFRVFRTYRNSIYYRLTEDEVLITLISDNRRDPQFVDEVLVKRNKK